MIKEFLRDEFPFYVKRITKKYYIIRRSELGAGFFSNYMWVLGHVVFACKLGYIPVVDMENYPTLYSEDKPVDGICNAWNYYFENIGDVSLEEAYNSKRYVFAKVKYLKKYSDRYCSGEYRFPSEETIDFYAPYIQKNMRIREDILNTFDKEFRELCDTGEEKISKVLGVHIRGTDMKNNLGHPMPAQTKRYIEEVKKLIERDGAYQKIYLATDEIDVVKLFRSTFDNTSLRLISQDAFRVSDNKQRRKVGLHETVVEHPREKHKYKLGLEVLRDAYFLSKCDSLICGHSNVTNVAIIWNGKKYEKTIVVDTE